MSARAPLGPPPPHYRPPGTPPPSVWDGPLPSAAGPEPPTPTRRGGAIAAAAAAVLVVGIAVGFVAGRASVDADSPPATAAPTSTVPSRTGETIPQQEPVAPGSEIPPASLGSRERPIPVGQAYVLGLFEVEVVAADLQARETLSAHDRANPAPPAGSEHVLVTIRVAFTGNRGVASTRDIPFFLSDGDRVWTANGSCGAVPDALDRSRLLGPGEEMTGNLCFTVPAPPAGLALGTDGFAGPVWFAIDG